MRMLQVLDYGGCGGDSCSCIHLLLLIYRRFLDSFGPRENMACCAAEQICPLNWNSVSYQADRGCQGSASSEQWRIVLRCTIGTIFFRPGRYFRPESQCLTKKTKRRVAVKNLVDCAIFGLLGQMECLNQHCMIAKHAFLSTLCNFAVSYCHWNINKAVLKGSRFKRENKVGMSFTMLMHWVWAFWFCSWCRYRIWMSLS